MTWNAQANLRVPKDKTMAKHNPYTLPRRASFVRLLLHGISRGGTGCADLDEDIITDVDGWGAATAEEMAAIVFELLDARGRERSECINGANESAAVWLHHLHAHVDEGHITDELRLAHVAAWRMKEK